ncbi:MULTISPECIES: glucuronate isomerase [Pelosinus]|uniref:Uronate isomerase n=1 Tax=Pelosinus fermentans B4 TaxID=1149862 RepID=I8RJ90_9FIRM|nr:MULTISPECIES: glucuronate isomerase [Pelosinus]MDF2571417.1 glucuronate isomerase [Sporomusa sp.]EIW20053.1 Glucuronate isomerase [Pelosinus fermentans B4]EIW26092.1 Uronate isomerase [Pelosinus fermentans A11]OAM93141.1 Uronate isomerase [Pelosinus fermentans DSM 17108]SDQ68329.1 D-glucuronate isomerase [Pelosinus fermentans]
MNGFMDENYLLETKTAKKLYFEYAKDMPIFDYHCHLPVQEIADDKKFENITQLWLSGDHYKWRALRANGISEEYITGNKSDYEKFKKWAETVPYTIGNPLFQWTYFELRHYFGIQNQLTLETADAIWNKCNDMLQQEDFSARNLIKRSNVKALCTTDDPVDTLEYHKRIKADETFDVKVLPTFRPDMALEVGHEKFRNWLNKLGNITGIAIETFEDYLAALKRRIQDFHEVGCRLSDHGLPEHFYREANLAEIHNIFDKRFDKQAISIEEQVKFRSAILIFLGKEYARHGWAMQIHLGAIRNTNTRMLRSIGINTGFDTIADYNIADELSLFLDALDTVQLLPKTILYCLNPRDNYMLAAMAGNFQSDIPGKVQFGSAWWFNDHEEGMIDQMKALSSIGLFSRFVGMLTDSRSFISYTRHEYFRRIVCNLVGNWVEQGSYYQDFDFLGKMIKGICFNNIKDYLNVEVE